jgi:hypothetical protein
MMQHPSFLPATEPAMSKLQTLTGIVVAFLLVAFGSIEYRNHIKSGLLGLLSVRDVAVTGTPVLFDGIPVKDINWE